MVDEVSSPTDSLPRISLTRCLRELANYVVLRNEEDLFENLERGGDVDLLVHDLDGAERTLIRHLGSPVRFIRSSYVRGYSYDWGNVDLLPSVEWRGARYLATEAVLQDRRISPGGRSVPSVAHEAVISWLTSLLWGGFFKERYEPVIRRAVEVDGVAFRQALIEAAGKTWGGRLWRAAGDGHPEISARWVVSLRRAVWWRAWFRSPVHTTRRYVAFAFAQLKLRLEPAAPWIAILGVDDDTKSSVTKELVDRSAGCPYGTVKVVHSSGRLIVDYWKRWVHLRAKGYVLAVDDSYVDAIDSRREGRDARTSLTRTLLRLLPTPDLLFFARLGARNASAG